MSDELARKPEGQSPEADRTEKVESWATDEGPPTLTKDDEVVVQSPAEGEKAVDLTADPPAERPNAADGEEYSIFTVAQKRAIVFAGSFTSWLSPMAGSIYYPALNQISADLHVTSSQINITVTTYLIVQGLAPMMIAGFSDKAGRRPAYFICFGIFIVANLALSLQNNYIALLLLRMLQSAGSSGTVALAQGLVGDCVVSSERGKYVAYASLGSILGPTVSPVLGGVISQFADWHWIFWFLLILSVVMFIPLALFLPETCRKIVGDGSVPPPRVCANLTDRARFRNRERKGIPVDEAKLAALRKNHRVSIPNPISTLRVLGDFEAGLLLLATGFAFACFYAISTGASQAFSTQYGFNDLQISLMFIPLGGGSLISAFTTGRMVDWNYARHAHRLDFPVHRNRQTDLSEFPIELARLQIALPLLWTGAVIVAAYGWILDRKVSLAGPIILLFFMGYCITAGFQVLSVLMVDIYPGQPATATAANNVVRCLLGAAATAAIGPMVAAMGSGWAYTTLSLLFLAASVFPAASMKYGIQWRKRKRERAERRAQRKSEQNERRRRKKEGE